MGVNCVFCQQSFPHNGKLERHLLSHTMEMPFNCNKCDRNYQSQFGLLYHEKTHLGERAKIHRCSVCKWKFFTKALLRKHLRVHNDHRPFKCNLCSKTLKSKGSLQDHMTIHTGEKGFTCLICYKQFPTSSSLAKHRIVHLKIKGRKCCQCSISFKNICNLKRHVKFVHGYTLNITEIPKHACVFCEKSFREKGNLMRHVITHIKEKPENCHICEKEFGTISDLNAHIIRYHKPRERNYCCNFCPARRYTKAELKIHLQTHTKRKPYTYNFCGKCYIKKTSLDNHITAVHTNEKSFKCGQCPKMFAYAELLRIHIINQHANIALVRCHICHKVLKNRTNLSQHIKQVHDKIKLYSCLFCGDETGFASYYGLLGHTFHHTKETWSFCIGCGRELRSKSSLRRHTKMCTKLENNLPRKKHNGVPLVAKMEPMDKIQPNIFSDYISVSRNARDVKLDVKTVSNQQNKNTACF